MKAFSCALAMLTALHGSSVMAQPASQRAATYTIALMSPELALQAAQAAMHACRQAGYQVSVAVVDRTGQTQVLLRDRLAGIHTVDAATGKAWTAASFKTGTTALAKATMSGTEAAGIRHIPVCSPWAAAYQSKRTVRCWVRSAYRVRRAAPLTMPAPAAAWQPLPTT